jgi:hypothetical protein
MTDDERLLTDDERLLEAWAAFKAEPEWPRIRERALGSGGNLHNAMCETFMYGWVAGSIFTADAITDARLKKEGNHEPASTQVN